jgi:Anti-sigma-K factor rskA, C-terminal
MRSKKGSRVMGRPDFRELVGEDLAPEERERLERVHELLIEAGPPPELPPALTQPDLDEREESAVAFLPRRRVGLMLGLAAAIALVAFVGGFVGGRARQPSFQTVASVPMHGTALASNATGTIDVGELDASGNWPLKFVAHGLKPLPKGQYYEMFLTRNGKPVVMCGTFRISSGESVRLNAPYLIRTGGWIVTLERPGSNSHPVVLTT